MRSVKFILCILLSILIFACNGDKIQEVEPNNSLASANEIPIDKEIHGFFNTNRDRDFYRIEVESDSVLDIQITGIRGVNQAMRIWKGGSEPKTLKLIDDNRKSAPERMANIHATAGTYFIEILHGHKDAKKANTEIPYKLTIKQRDAILEESEANDTSEDADPISADEEMCGYFSPAYNRLNRDREHYNREEDWYVIDVNLNDDEPVMMDVSLSAVLNINSELYLYDDSKTEIAHIDNGGKSDPEEIKGVGIKKSGKYYIMVTCKNYEVNNEEPYFVSVSFNEFDASLEMETNNVIDKANTILNNSVSGEINYTDDIDYFLYKAESGSLPYWIELQSSEGIDGVITIYNKNKEKVLEINNSPKGEKEVYPNYIAKGDIYIAVSSRVTDKMNEKRYTLSVLPSNESNMEIEPNDTKAGANRIKDSLIKGYISKRMDKDYFYLQYEKRRKNEFEITGVKGGDIKVSVTDSLGYIIKSITVRNNARRKLTEWIDGKGYLIIEAQKENYENPYKIVIRGK